MSLASRHYCHECGERVSTVTVDQTLEGWGAKLHIGHQHFTVGPQDYEEKPDAEWMATMLRKALGKMNAQVDRTERQANDGMQSHNDTV